MKTTKPFTILLFAILLINACSKDCTEKTINKYVDKNYLPYIIPYSDTSTRLFLKNGTDTLLFKSQGLKETVNDYYNTFRCETFKLQQYSLKMAASDTDFFQVKYSADWQEIPTVQYASFGIETYKIDDSRYIDFFQLKQLKVLNHMYDSISISPNSYGDTVYTNLKFGIVRVKVLHNIYELIK